MLKSGGRVLIEAPPAGSLGRALLSALRRPVRPGACREGGRRHFRPRASSPRSASRARLAGPQHIFVNRRIVRDRTIAHAIQQAYSVATIKERSPEVHLFIERSRPTGWT